MDASTREDSSKVACSHLQTPQEGWTPAERTRSQKAHGAAIPGSARHASPGQPSPASHGDASPAAARRHFSKKPDLSPSISGPVRQKAALVRLEGSLTNALKQKNDKFVAVRTAA